jgi:hypothetical protein
VESAIQAWGSGTEAMIAGMGHYLSELVGYWAARKHIIEYQIVSTIRVLQESGVTETVCLLNGIRAVPLSETKPGVEEEYTEPAREEADDLEI